MTEKYLENRQIFGKEVTYRVVHGKGGNKEQGDRGYFEFNANAI